MMTTTTSTTGTFNAGGFSAATTLTNNVGAAQKVVIVNGNAEILDLFETVLEARHYDIVFVESSERAYSQIKRVQPNLVILCVRIDDDQTFRVLSMLKLDEETRGIPVLTYAAEFEGLEPVDEIAEPSEAEIVAARPAMRMN
jgi:PleD family two-component response regulator